MKHPEASNGRPYLVVQIHPAADPAMEAIKSNFLTGDGTLVAVSCDGYYARREDAEAVAKWFAEMHPHINTHVVEIVWSKVPA